MDKNTPHSPSAINHTNSPSTASDSPTRPIVRVRRGRTAVVFNNNLNSSNSSTINATTTQTLGSSSSSSSSGASSSLATTGSVGNNVSNNNNAKHRMTTFTPPSPSSLSSTSSNSEKSISPRVAVMNSQQENFRKSIMEVNGKSSSNTHSNTSSPISLEDDKEDFEEGK